MHPAPTSLPWELTPFFTFLACFFLFSFSSSGRFSGKHSLFNLSGISLGNTFRSSSCQGNNVETALPELTFLNRLLNTFKKLELWVGFSST